MIPLRQAAIGVLALIGAVAPLGGAHATHQQVEGTVLGYACVTQGISCPEGGEDAVVSSEKIFVVQTDDDGYFFVSNLDRAVLARHLGHRVRVTGDVDRKFQSVRAKILEVRRGDKWEVAWSKEMENEMRRRMRLDE